MVQGAAHRLDLATRQVAVADDLDTLLHTWENWLRDERQASRHTLNAYRRDLRAFLNYLGEHYEPPLSLTTLATLPPETSTAYRTHGAARGQAPASIARALATLRNFFRFLEGHGIACHPALYQIASPRVTRPPAVPLSASAAQQAVERVAVLSDAPWLAKRDMALFALLYGSGLQLGEALALNRAQAPQGEVLTVGGGDRQRTVPVLPGVPVLLNDYLYACPYRLDGDEPLFVGSRGRRLNPGVVQRQLRRVRRLLQLPAGTTPRTFRQVFVQQLQAAGQDIRAIQTLLGHAFASTTQHWLTRESDDQA
jgi:integrase/recombinase XerC